MEKMEKNAKVRLEKYAKYVAQAYYVNKPVGGLLHLIAKELKNRIKKASEENVNYDRAIEVYNNLFPSPRPESLILPCDHKITKADLETQAQNPNFIRVKCPSCSYLVLEDDLLDMFPLPALWKFVPIGPVNKEGCPFCFGKDNLFALHDSHYICVACYDEVFFKRCKFPQCEYLRCPWPGCKACLLKKRTVVDPVELSEYAGVGEIPIKVCLDLDYEP